MKSRTNGTLGVYLKEVGGPVRAACNEQTTFEPASTIKVLFHLHALLQVQSGSVIQGQVVTLETPIRWFTHYNKKNGTSCPADSGSATNELKDVLKAMMVNSDNRHTQAIAAFFGRENINATAQAIGMRNTSVNHRIGCVFGDGGVDNPNQLTLYDAGRLYEQVADGTLLDEAHRRGFYSLMAGKEADASRVWQRLQELIEQEAPAGMTRQQQQTFAQQVDTHYKAGNYTFCTPNCLYYRSIAGWVRLPLCNNDSVTWRSYVFGLFIHESRTDGGSTSAFNDAKAELLREQIRDGLQSCASAG